MFQFRSIFSQKGRGGGAKFGIIIKLRNYGVKRIRTHTLIDKVRTVQYGYTTVQYNTVVFGAIYIAPV